MPGKRCTALQALCGALHYKKCTLTLKLQCNPSTKPVLTHHNHNQHHNETWAVYVQNALCGAMHLKKCTALHSHNVGSGNGTKHYKNISALHSHNARNGNASRTVWYNALNCMNSSLHYCTETKSTGT